jgi:phage tail sheath protein FI
MPEYLAPGVYTEEISTGPVPIEGVSTSTAGFAGPTERGPVQPRLVTSWIDFQRWYGGLLDPARTYTPWAVKGFFDNNGQRLFVARVVGEQSAAASVALGGLTVQAIGPGDLNGRLFVRVNPASQRDPANPANPDPNRVRVTVLSYTKTPPAPLVDPFDPQLIRDPNRREPDLVEDYDNVTAGEMEVTLRSSTLIAASFAGQPPALPPVAPFAPLVGGTDGQPLKQADYEGDGTAPIDQRTGLAGLAVIDEISLLCVPDEVRFPNLRGELVTQCEQLKDRFAILQVERGQANPNAVNPPFTTSYAAIYYPWVRVFDPNTQGTQLVPPGGHVTGIYAATDIDRGVHKAPANVDVRGILTRDLPGNEKPLEYAITKGYHDLLNPKGINVIRDFRADRRGIRVWGARTMSDNAQWKYVNVRRLFIFVEESISEGTQWVVFEPNDEPTWARVRRSITNFLTSVWRSGALMGGTVEEAFYVKCDRSTMTQDDIDNGRLICLIGMAPVKPAEFVILRFSQKTAEAQT